MKKSIVLLALTLLTLVSSASEKKLKLYWTTVFNTEKQVWEVSKDIKPTDVTYIIDDIAGTVIVKTGETKVIYYKIKLNYNYIRKIDKRYARVSSYNYQSNCGQHVEISFKEYKHSNKRHRNTISFKRGKHIMCYFM